MRLDLTGQIYGTIKCIEPGENQGNRTTWLCECIKCGQRKIIKTHDIRGGKIKSCGCGCTENFIGNERVCKICGKTFLLKPYGYTRQYCYDCSPDGDVKSRVVGYRQAAKKGLVEYKGGQCQICGYNKCIDALQFHHLDPTQKDFTISKSTKPYDELKAEVDKCILVCANCHAEIHHNLYEQGLIEEV